MKKRTNIMMKMLAGLLSLIMILSAIALPIMADGTATSTMTVDGIMGEGEGWDNVRVYEFDQHVLDATGKDAIHRDDRAESVTGKSSIRYSYDAENIYVYYETSNSDSLLQTSGSSSGLYLRIVPQLGTDMREANVTDGAYFHIQLNLANNLTCTNEDVVGSIYDLSHTADDKFGLGVKTLINQFGFFGWYDSYGHYSTDFANNSLIALHVEKDEGGTPIKKSIEMKLPMSDTYKARIAANAANGSNDPIFYFTAYERTRMYNGEFVPQEKDSNDVVTNVGTSTGGYLVSLDGENPVSWGYDNPGYKENSRVESGVPVTLPVPGVDPTAPADATLIYTVDFRGDDTFTPTTLGAAQATFTPSADGTSVTINAIENATTDTRTFWGGTFKDMVADDSTIYTMIYKVKCSKPEDSNSAIGVGGWFTDGKFELYTHDSAVDEGAKNKNMKYYGQYTNHNIKARLGQGRAQIVGDVNITSADLDVTTDGFVTTKLVYNGITGKFSNYFLKKGTTGASESDWMQISEADMAVGTSDSMGFVTYVYRPTPTDGTVIKDVKIYKSAKGPRLIYTVDFNGDIIFTPSSPENDQNKATFTPSADGTSLTITNNGVAEADKGTTTRDYWGGVFNGLTIGENDIYTLVYKVKCSQPTDANSAISVGAVLTDGEFKLKDGTSGSSADVNCYIQYTNHHIKSRLGLGRDWSVASDYKNITTADLDTTDGYVTTKIVYDFTTQKFSNYYLKKDGTWMQLDEGVMNNVSNAVLGFVLGATRPYYTDGTVIKDVQLYKETVEVEPELPTATGVLDKTITVDGVANAAEGWSADPLLTLGVYNSSTTAKPEEAGATWEAATTAPTMKVSYDASNMYIYYEVTKDSQNSGVWEAAMGATSQRLYIVLTPEDGVFAHGDANGFSKNGDIFRLVVDMGVPAGASTTESTTTTWSGANADDMVGIGKLVRMYNYGCLTAGWVDQNFAQGDRMYQELEIAYVYDPVNGTKTVEIKVPLGETTVQNLRANTDTDARISVFERHANWQGYTTADGAYDQSGRTRVGVKFTFAKLGENSTPSDPTPSDPTPSDPTPSDPTPSDPTPSDPAPSDPTPETNAPETNAPTTPTEKKKGCGGVIGAGFAVLAIISCAGVACFKKHDEE